MNSGNDLKIWDPFVRLFHWLLVAAFAVCYVTEGKPRWVHVDSGYIIATLIVLRTLWGFAGPRHARFSDFVRSPKEILAHLKEVARFRAKRYLGHDPAGGIMIVALLVSASLTVLSGMVLYGAKDKGGPFAAWHDQGTLHIPFFAQTVMAESGKQEKENGHGAAKGEKQDSEWLEEGHEFFASFTLTLAIIHICGVLLVSLETRENLIRSMITGRKKAVEAYR